MVWVMTMLTQQLSLVKCLPAMPEIQVQSLGREDPLEKEMATHSSILAWIIPLTEEPGELQSLGSQWVRHNQVTNTMQTQCLTLWRELLADTGRDGVENGRNGPAKSWPSSSTGSASGNSTYCRSAYAGSHGFHVYGAKNIWSEVAQLCPTLCDPIDCSPPGSSSMGILLTHALLQGIFPTQGSNLGLLHCRQILYYLSPRGSPSCSSSFWI